MSAGRSARRVRCALRRALVARRRCRAGGVGWARTDHAATCGWSRRSGASGEAETLRLGLQFQLKPGWKTYWRSPGDAGFPPRVDWSGSRESRRRDDLRWPAPKRFELFGLETFGYDGEVVLPVDVQAGAARAQPLRCARDVDYLSARRSASPTTAQLALDLPAGPAAASDVRASDRPLRGARAGRRQRARPDDRRAPRSGDGASPELLVVGARARRRSQRPTCSSKAPTAGASRAARRRFSDGGRQAVLRVPVAPRRRQRAGREQRRASTLTLVDGERAAERALTVDAGRRRDAGDARASRRSWRWRCSAGSSST